MRQIATKGRIKIVTYKHGSKVLWPIVPAAQTRSERNPRGIIRDMSGKVRRVCAWTAGNMPRDWGAMVTLTVRDAPPFPKKLREAWQRAWRSKWGTGIQWLVVMEFTKRGRCHWHFFIEREFMADRLADGGSWTQTVTRNGEATEIVRGEFDRWCVDTWAQIVGDESRAFRRFQNGGIVELLRSADAAARYVAKECGKRAQKQLPEGVDPQGAWWGYNKQFKPVPTGVGVISRWPYERIYGLVFDTGDALKKEKLTSRRQSLRVTTSHNICVGKAHEAMRRRNEKCLMLSSPYSSPSSASAQDGVNR